MDPALIMEDDAVVAEDSSPELMKLEREYTFWIFIKSSNRAADDWKPKPIANFGTVNDFWSIYQHLKRPNQLEAGTMINLFVKGIQPAWEDEQNANGGRWQIRFNKAQPLVSNKLWEDLILGVIGEQFTYPDEICGIVISIRNNQDTMSIWNKSGRDQDIINTIRQDIVKILGIPDSAQMFYEQFNMTEDEKHQQAAQKPRGKQDGEEAK